MNTKKPMKRPAILVLLVLTGVLLSCAGKKLVNPGFDFSSLDQFFYIVSILEKDQQPSDADWDALFATTGYKTLMSHEKSLFNEKYFKKYFSLAFMPSRKEALEKELAELREKGKKSFGYYLRASYVAHYVNIRDRKEEMLAFVDSLKYTPMTDAAVEKARAFLPDMEISGTPSVCFIVFGNDGRGYSPVIMDLGYIMAFGPDLLLLFGHEYHHYYIHQIWKYDEERVEEKDAPFMWAIGQIYKEGLADQVDKVKRYYEGEVNPYHAAWADKFKNAVEDTPQVISVLNTILESMADEPEARLELGREFSRSVPQSGHPTGFYMSRMIRENLGKEALIRDAGNPFAFFRTYNQAASGVQDAPLFSDKAMGVIEELEMKYVGEV
jgi:hypothetical protein